MSLLKPSILRVKFDNFANLPSRAGDNVYSEKKVDCHGNAWNVELHPGGMSFSDDPFVAIYLHHQGESSIDSIFSFILRDAIGKNHHEWTAARQLRFEGVDSWGADRFFKRSDLLDKANDILVDGALIIDVHLQFVPKEQSHTPSSSLTDKMLQLLESEDGADASFEVGREVIAAHRLILQMNASLLFNFCEENNDGSPIPINDTAPEIFRILLRYAYGEEVPETSTIKEKGREIIDAADKFGVVDLKLAVETALVEALVMDVENVADWLVFADAKTCPLLKEQAVAYFVSRSADVLRSDGSKKFKQSPRLLTELMLELAESANDDNYFGDRQKVSVSVLRKMLREKGLDVDGSKEMLASRLQESNERQRVE